MLPNRLLERLGSVFREQVGGVKNENYKANLIHSEFKQTYLSLQYFRFFKANPRFFINSV